MRFYRIIKSFYRIFDHFYEHLVIVPWTSKHLLIVHELKQALIILILYDLIFNILFDTIASGRCRNRIQYRFAVAPSRDYFFFYYIKFRTLAKILDIFEIRRK